MTNSAKQTKNSKGATAPPTPAQAGDRAGEFRKPALLLAGLAGAFFILHVNRYHITVPVFMLWLGWFGVLATVDLLWSAGAALGEGGGESIEISGLRQRELLSEKKSLIRAIKEIEFDRDLGKMSPEDAKEIMRFYRARAIEVIKELDGKDDAELSIAERIERDVQARLAVQVPKKKAKKKPASSEASADQKSVEDTSAEESAEEASTEDASEEQVEEDKGASVESA